MRREKCFLYISLKNNGMFFKYLFERMLWIMQCDYASWYILRSWVYVADCGWETTSNETQTPPSLYSLCLVLIQEMLPCLVVRNRTQSASTESDADRENFIKEILIDTEKHLSDVWKQRWINNIDRYLRHILEIEEGKYWFLLEKFRSMMLAGTHN